MIITLYRFVLMMELALVVLVSRWLIVSNENRIVERLDRLRENLERFK